MFIMESYRGQGIGKMFFDAFVKECHDKNITDIRVTASAKNKGAIAAYEKWGFSTKNTTLNYKL